MKQLQLAEVARLNNGLPESLYSTEALGTRTLTLFLCSLCLQF